jgi:hypothetical protein
VVTAAQAEGRLMTDHHDRRGIIDRAQSAGLFDVGSPTHDAATVVGADGSTHFALVCRSSVGNLGALYDENCCAAAHEQIGPLPLDIVQRIAVRQPTTPPDERTEL